MRGISNEKSYFQESIVDFTKQEIKKDRSLTAREISWRWAFNCLELLKKLGTLGRQLTSPAIMYIISVTMVEMGSSHYNFGSRTIGDQLRNYVVKLAEERGKPQPREVYQEEEEEDQPQPEVQPQHEVQPQPKDQPEPDVPEAQSEVEAAPQAPLQPDLGEDVQDDEEEPDQDEPANPGKKRKKRATVDDPFLIHLLHHYIVHAPDLMKRDRTLSGRAKAIKQLEAIMKSNNQMNNGARLSNYNTDNLAKKLAFEKWWGRTGLLGFIDEHFENIGKIQSHHAIQAEISAIMSLASSAKAGLRPVGPPSPPRSKKVAKPVVTTPVEKQASPPQADGLLAKLVKRREDLASGPSGLASGPPCFALDNLGRVTRFKELISDCFASEANELNQGWLRVKLVKAWVAQSQKHCSHMERGPKFVKKGTKRGPDFE